MTDLCIVNVYTEREAKQFCSIKREQTDEFIQQGYIFLLMSQITLFGLLGYLYSAIEKREKKPLI